MTVLVPQLTSLLEGSGKKLPMATQLLMDFTHIFQAYWWAMLAFIIIFGLSFKSYIATTAGRMWWHRTRLKLPLFGPVIATRFYAQFASSMGNLISNGIPLLNGLKLSSRATDNIFLQGLLVRVVSMVGEGASLSNALKKVGHFPSLLVDMIAVGETTGTLGRSLEKTALRYDKELDKRIKTLITFISPTIMIFMAVIVGTVAYSIVTAILETSQGIRSQG
jgi:general secretion pathway protein F/type IV pilus assembly protein PilC